MKTKRLLLVLSCLLFLPVAGYAQNISEMRPPELQRQFERHGTKTAIRSDWNGSLVLRVSHGVFDPEIRAAWNVSDEQHQEIMEISGSRFWHEFMQSPEAHAIMEEERLYFRSPHMQDADEKTIAVKAAEFHSRRHAAVLKLQAEAMENLLTAEQKRMIQEFQLATMEMMPVISPRMFDALDLTDAQRLEMERIQEELEPEFERILENLVTSNRIISDKIREEFIRQGDGDLNLFDERRDAIHGRLLAEDPEYKQIHDDIRSNGKDFSTQFRIKMFDVLTDEQWFRLQELIDNPAEYIRAFLQRRRAQEAAQEGRWQPSPGSWQPGMPIPEEYRERRNLDRRFPRPQN